MKKIIGSAVLIGLCFLIFNGTESFQKTEASIEDNGIEGVSYDMASISMYMRCMKIRNDLYQPECSHNKLLMELEKHCKNHIQYLSGTLNNRDTQTRNIALFLTALFRSNLDGIRNLKEIERKERFSKENLDCSFAKTQGMEGNLEILKEALNSDFNGATKYIISSHRESTAMLIMPHFRGYYLNNELTTCLLNFIERLDSKTYYEYEGPFANR